MKVDGSLGSLVQGVSQQAPAQRRQGQHTAQVNMLADPVRGLSRRHGTLWQAERDLQLDELNAAANLADSAGYRSFDYTAGGRDLVVLYRAAARAAGSDMPPVIVYDKTNKQFLTVVRNGSDTLLDTLAAGGASAVTAVGKYVFLAGNTITPAGTNTDLWGDTTNQQRTVLWVRDGAYSRTFKATVTKADDSQVSFEYTTPAASYPGVLDTSGVPVWLPDTAGSGAGTGPTLLTAFEAQSGVKLASSTITLGHAAESPTSISVVRGNGYNNEYDFPRVTFVDGLDYSVTAGVITFLRDVDFGVYADSGVTYQYAPGGTSATVTYATQADTEAVYIQANGAYGVAELIYKDWNPTALTVRNEQQVLTNVYPALPANPNEYAWAGGTAGIVFSGALVGNLKVTAAYTHTKVVSNPHYTKQVTDLTNEYNTAVTQWIGTSSAAIQPEAIAESLRTAAEAAGLTGVTVQGSTVIFTAVKGITVSDGGDGSFLKGLANTALSVDDLTDAHWVGKVVKISPSGGESFYMKATAKNASITSGVTEVLWVEGAGIGRTIDSALVYGVADGASFYIAGSAALLAAILPGTHPTYAAATVGDDDSSPMPYFIGRKISYLGVFQDRLLIGAGAVLRCSKVGDYLNFFRSSVLTVPADDPLEMLSQGSEDDTLRFSALYDRDLILFGKRQYAVSGRTPLTPTSANMPVMSSHDGADDAQPRSAGGLIFYAKQGQASTSVHQIEPGRNPESPESYPASSQLDDYMAGDPVDLLAVPKPSTLIVRTSAARHSLYAYSYLDSSERRLQDCWHRWDYAEELGPTLGVTTVREGVLVFTLRQVNDSAAAFKQYAVADLQPLDGQLSTRPYLDSARKWADVVASPGSLHSASVGFSAAYGAGPQFLQGVASLADVPDMLTELGEAATLYAGMPFAAYWSPTNPQWHDNDGRSIEEGRLVVTSLTLAYRDSSGFRSVVTAHGSDTEFEFNGLVVDNENNVVGQVPVTKGRMSVGVGRARDEYEQTIYARSWLPLNITSVSFTGQLFHRPRRVG